MPDKIYCGIAGCETEATHKTDGGTPLCTPCHYAYELGHCSFSGNTKVLEQKEEILSNQIHGQNFIR